MCSIRNTLVRQKSLSEGRQTVRGNASFQAPLLKFFYDPFLSVRLSQLFVFIGIYLQGIYCKLCQKVFELKLKTQQNRLTFSEELRRNKTNLADI